MDSRQSSLRRSVTQRRSIRSSKRLSRSTSGISPLAMSLLRSQHEQKKAALLQERAFRREMFNPLTHGNLNAEDDREEEDAEEEIQLIPTALDSSMIPLIPSSCGEEVTEKKKHKGGKKFRAVRRRVSKVMSRVFLRKSSKKPEEAEVVKTYAELRAFRRYPCTEL